jgi:hypothetical protein
MVCETSLVTMMYHNHWYEASYFQQTSRQFIVLDRNRL